MHGHSFEQWGFSFHFHRILNQILIRLYQSLPNKCLQGELHWAETCSAVEEKNLPVKWFNHWRALRRLPCFFLCSHLTLCQEVSEMFSNNFSGTGEVSLTNRGKIRKEEKRNKNLSIPERHPVPSQWPKTPRFATSKHHKGTVPRNSSSTVGLALSPLGPSCMAHEAALMLVRWRRT